MERATTGTERDRMIARHLSWVLSGGKSGAPADFCDTPLDGVNFHAHTLDGARFARASLRRAELRRARLRRADFAGADLSGALLHDADLNGADLRGADLSRAELIRADLTDADLRGARLEGTRLYKAVLRAARLDEGALEGVEDLDEAEIRGGGP